MKPLSTINVIPFIDIMLVLLAVVLTTATFVAQGKIPVALPEATHAEPMQSDVSIELTIDRAGQVYLGEEAIDLERLASRLASVDPRTQVMVRVDEATPFAYFVRVVDLLKAREMENLAIVTRRGSG